MVSLYQQTQQVIGKVRLETNRALLFYSCGKDSIVLLDLLSKEFDEVVCVFMYFVKGLAHIERYIIFSERRYKNVRFIQIPHWNLTKIHSVGMYCAPMKVRQLSFSEVVKAQKIATGIQWAFIGNKQADNMSRRLMLRTYEDEAICRESRNVYPLSHWRDGDVLKYIQKNKLLKPIQYAKKRSNGVGFNEECYVWLREHYPNDLKKILSVYPLSEKILFDYEQRKIQKK